MRVLFDAAPTQYLLNSVIRKHVKNYRKSDPQFEKIVNLGFYVDDLNTSVKTSNEGVEFAEAEDLMCESGDHRPYTKTNFCRKGS